MDINLNRFNTIPPEAEPGMNLISADFDLVMVNRANERLYGKSMVDLLGKKCYREFEKRDAPCTHCPGRLSLETGESHVAETEGLRDDGTRFSARVRTHPVQGPGGRRTGFIEVVEDITEEKRAERLTRIDEELQTALGVATTVSKALWDCLDAALKVEGIDAACLFSVDWVGLESALVCQKGFPPDYVAALVESGLELTTSGGLPGHLAGLPGAPRAGEVVPIAGRGRTTAVLVAGAYVYPAIPPSLRAGLHGLGATTGQAIARILAEQSRGDAVADLEAFITMAPLATWLVNRAGRVTMWNRAAEQLLGWSAAEVVGRRPPFEIHCDLTSADRQGAKHEATFLTKRGDPVDVRLTAVPFRDVVGNASDLVVMAEDLTLRRRLDALEQAGTSGTGDSRCGTEPASAPQREPHSENGAPPSIARPVLVLVIDSDRRRNDESVCALTAEGWEAVGCSSLEEAVRNLETPGRKDATVVTLTELIGADGSNALAVRMGLRAAGVNGPVIVCSDAAVIGYEFHGFFAVLKRPYTANDLRKTVERALLSPPC